MKTSQASRTDARALEASSAKLLEDEFSPASYRLRDNEGTVSLPRTLVEPSKKILYVLFVNYPTSYSVFSLVSAAGVSMQEARQSLKELRDRGLLEIRSNQILEIPPEVRFMRPEIGDSDPIDACMFALKSARYTDAIAVLQEEETH